MSSQRDNTTPVNILILEPHACAWGGSLCSDMRDTTSLGKMSVRQGVLSTHSVAYKGVAISCKRNFLDNHAIESLDVRVATNFCVDDEEEEGCEK